MYEQMTAGTSEAAYNVARSRALRGRVWSKLTGQPNSLLSLSDVSATCDVGARRHAGIRTVRMEKIRGSEGRCNDFDRDFYPLQEHTAGRWRSIARAREMGKPLPPVDLVQVGDTYFVLDGHHRISVARTMGQMAIEAKVTEWQVEDPLPWESSENGSQRTAVAQLLSTVGENGARVRDRVMASFRSLLPAGGTA
jgi:hypothetical protein